MHNIFFIKILIYKNNKMKITILSIITVALTSTSLFAQIPNNGFENWTTVGTNSVPNNWGTMNNTTAMASVYTATKGTPGSPGTSYLKLTSKAVGTSVVNGIAVSGVLDSTTMMPKCGFAFNQRPASFAGKWQYMIYGSSPGSVNVLLTRWNAVTNTRVTVASGNVTHSASGMAMSWANFTIPLIYVDGNNPDSCIIVLKASGSNPTANDYLWVDNLVFTGVVTGIQNQESFLSDMTIFPNPSAETVHVNLNLKSEQHITIEVLDVIGKLMVSQDLGILQGETKQVISVNGIAKGTYFLRVNTNNGIEVKKLIIE
jgi:hypothetical protein